MYPWICMTILITKLFHYRFKSLRDSRLLQSNGDKERTGRYVHDQYITLDDAHQSQKGCSSKSLLSVLAKLLQEMLGTNPIAFGAPGIEGDDFMLDMATTAVAVGKVLSDY